MATIAEQLTELAQGNTNIRNAIVAKGVSVPESTPFVQLGNKIAQIEGGGAVTPTIDYGWSRPADRPELPFEGEPEENEIYLLFGATPYSLNGFAWVTPTVSGGSTVDWGDGSAVESAASGATIKHTFNYDALAVTPNTAGIKFVWVSIKGAGTITSIVNMQAAAPTGRTTPFIHQIYEIYMKATECAGYFASGASYVTTYRLALLEVFHWYGENKLTSTAYVGSNWASLRSIKMYTGLATNMTYTLYGVQGAMPVNMDWFDTSSATNLNTILRPATTLNVPLTIDLLSHTDQWPTTLGSELWLVPSLRIKNMGIVHSTINLNTMGLFSLDVDALVNLFNDLYDRSTWGTGTITITGCFGANSLTTAQRAIATGKNWTIA